MKKKTELAIDEDLLRRAKAAASEIGADFDLFVENGIRKQLVEYSTRKAKREARLKDPEVQARKRRVEEYWGNLSLDRETIEAILEEPSYLDV